MLSHVGRVRQIERNLQDALCVARNVVKDPRLVPGGGAVEMAVARVLQDPSLTLPGCSALPSCLPHPVHTSVYTCWWIRIFTYMSLCIRAHICLYTHICMCLDVYVCSWMCMYVSVHIRTCLLTCGCL